jgi:hypothetical protein
MRAEFGTELSRPRWRSSRKQAATSLKGQMPRHSARRSNGASLRRMYLDKHPLKIARHKQRPYSRWPSLKPRRASPPATMRATQLTHFGTDQSPMMSVHSAKIRTRWNNATTAKTTPATRENVFASMSDHPKRTSAVAGSHSSTTESADPFTHRLQHQVGRGIDQMHVVEVCVKPHRLPGRGGGGWLHA